MEFFLVSGQIPRSSTLVELFGFSVTPAAAIAHNVKFFKRFLIKNKHFAIACWILVYLQFLYSCESANSH